MENILDTESAFVNLFLIINDKLINHLKGGWIKFILLNFNQDVHHNFKLKFTFITLAKQKL